MRSKTRFFLLLAVLLLAAVPNDSCFASATTRPTNNITLYAHSDSTATSVGGRTLSAASVTGERSTADATRVVTFTLIPALVAPLHILGTVAVSVWLQSGQNVEGSLHVAISEIRADGTVVQIRSANATANVRQARPSGAVFAFGGINHTLSKGSSISLETQFTPTTQTRILLLWDDPATPTSLTIEAEDVITVEIQIIGRNKRASVVLSTNDTLVASVNVLDVFGSHDIRSVTLSIRNSTGSLIVSDAPTVLAGQDPLTGSYAFETGIAVPRGLYETSATVRDTSNNSYTGSSEFLVTEFYPVSVAVSDMLGNPVRNATVFILLNSTVVDSGKTDAEGSVVLSAPSSREVGAFSITMEYGQGRMVLTDRIDISGHDMVRLEAPLSDWTILVRYQMLGLPIIGATVHLEVENSTIASGATGSDGSVSFKQMTAGNYTIAVESPWVNYRVTVDHPLENATSLVDIPLVAVVNNVVDRVLQMWPVIFLLVLVSTFGIYAVRRSRKRRPLPFAHFKAILGGALPSADITMICGNPGSGKTQMMYNMIGERLAENRPAIFVTNVGFPGKVREALKRLGIDVDTSEKRKALRFVDCYAGLAGVQSGEMHHVSSPTDFTALGMQISSCLEEVGVKSDVYVDSITPTIVNGAFERALSFVRHYGARVKSQDASFFYTISSSMESETLARFEDEADSVIQLELYEAEGATRRRMRVKKARGSGHRRDWTNFAINSRGEIELLTD